MRSPARCQLRGTPWITRSCGRLWPAPRKGWPVFPCHPGRKVAATSNGYHDATTDPAQIREWFAGHPELNLAVATGAPGPDVLDIGYHGRDGDGFHGLWHLREAELLNGASACIDTPNGGLHLYFDGSSQRSSSLPDFHFDFIAKGGYVLVPPSRVAGRSYADVNIPGKHGGLDWTAAARLLDPSGTRERPPHPQASPEPPGHEAGA